MLRNNANFNLMEKTARRVGRMLLRDFDEIRQLQTSVRGVDEFARRARERAETAIVEALTETRPNYGVRSTVFGCRDGKDPTRYWIVDALDGAKNYLHGLPHWAIKLALEQKGEVVLAVILDPVANELFAAERGDGSWLNDVRMRVSSRNRLNDLIVNLDLDAGEGDLDFEAFERTTGELGGTVAAVRSFGAPSLDLAYVAAGRLDACASARAVPDAIAAGRLILTESGGLSEPFDFDPDSKGRGVIAAADGAFPAFRSLIRGSR